MLAGTAGELHLVASEYVLEETARNIRKKAPQAIGDFETFQDQGLFLIVAPDSDLVAEIARSVEPKDAPIIAGAIAAQATHLVSYDRRHILSQATFLSKGYGLIACTPDAMVKNTDSWTAS